MTNQQRIVVATGASSGIGKAITLSLASPNTRLCLVGRNLKALALVVGDAEQRGATTHSYFADLSVDSEVATASSAILRDCAGVDVLVHSAGIWSGGTLEDSPVHEFDLQYRVNVHAPYFLTQKLLPGIRERKGHVIFINSSAAQAARAGIAQYAATKHALKAVADSLREEVNDAGVRVTSLFLGRTATPMQAAVFAAEGRSYRPELLIQPEDVALVVSNILSLASTAEITEISMRPLVKSY